MKFWDSSAIVPLLAGEAEREPLLMQLGQDAAIVIWWGTPVECTSAIARREREGRLATGEATRALEGLRVLARAWREIVPSEPVRLVAQRLLRVHPLRVADSLQLAAAVLAADGDPTSLPFVCLDERLCDAAEREGFPVLRPARPSP